MSTRRSKRLSVVRRNNFTAEDRELIEKKQVENLQRDNYQDEPDADTTPHMALKYEGLKGLGERKLRLRKIEISEYFKTRFKKSFDQIVDEGVKKQRTTVNYLTARAPPPTRPRRKFCQVCGFPSKYRCTACDVKYCSIVCLDIHKDTRCMKHVV